MLNVLHVTNAYPYPEVPEYGIFIKEQIDSLSQTGTIHNEVVFINGRREGKKAYLEGIAEIRRRAGDCDLIHCHHLYSGFAAAAALTGKPRVLSFLNDWLHEIEGVRSEMMRTALCNIGVWSADRLIFKSPIPQRYRNDKRFIYLPNGANSAQFHITDRQTARKALNLDLEAVYLLFVSSKDIGRPQKRYDRFKKVVEIVQSSFQGRRVEELILVNQPRDRVLDFFNAADLHLMTSDFEGSPNSVKEAVCCGTPVVTTNVGNVQHLLENVPFCRVASDFDVQELASLVGDLLLEQVDRDEIRKSFLAKNFTQEETAGRLEKVYKELISARYGKIPMN